MKAKIGRFKVIYVWVLAMTLMSSCAFEQHHKSSRQADVGQVFIYLSSPKKPAVDISFAVSGISFLDNSDDWIDLALERKIDSGDLSEKQLKVSELYLPAGKYRRLKFKINEAKVKRGLKTFSLALPEPDGESIFDIEFVVYRQESLTLFVDWDPDESIFNQYLFKPKISVRKQGIEIKKILVYVANSGSDAVTIIDRQQDEVVGTVAVGKAPKGIVANADGTKIYVANSRSNSISVIDTTAMRVTKTIGNFGYSPSELALSGDGRKLYAVNPDSDNVSIIDTVSKMVTQRISVGRHPVDIVFDEDRDKLYVANRGENTISVINANTEKVEDTVTVDLMPCGLAVKDNKLYVANYGSNTVSVIKLGSYSVSKTIAVGQGPVRVFAGLSGWVYVTNANSNDVSLIYTSMDMVTQSVSVQDFPLNMAIDTLRRKLYVVNKLSDEVSVIGLASKRVKVTIEVGQKPYGIVVVEE